MHISARKEGMRIISASEHRLYLPASRYIEGGGGGRGATQIAETSRAIEGGGGLPG